MTTWSAVLYDFDLSGFSFKELLTAEKQKQRGQAYTLDKLIVGLWKALFPSQFLGVLMARPLTIIYPGAFSHIISRGNQRKDIFKSQADREKFLSYKETKS